ncbi:hypothetical protein KPA99_33615, partial [Burkholderia cenocepacia]|nr:hypothetical protein [Burkholderia cenocepacia]
SSAPFTPKRLPSRLPLPRPTRFLPERAGVRVEAVFQREDRLQPAAEILRAFHAEAVAEQVAVAEADEVLARARRCSG